VEYKAILGGSLIEIEEIEQYAGGGCAETDPSPCVFDTPREHKPDRFSNVQYGACQHLWSATFL